MDKFLVPFNAIERLPARRIGVLAPHPDDEVFGCGGLLTLMRETASIRVVVLTNGERQPGQTPTSRQQESRNAAECLGIEAPSFWGLPDGHLQTIDLKNPIAEWLNAHQLDLLLCPSPWEVHPDHRAVAEACIAVLRGQYENQNQCVDQAEDSKSNHLPLTKPALPQLGFYEIGTPLAEVSHLVNIGAVYSLKLLAMEAFTSQQLYQSYKEKIIGLNRYRTYTLADEIRYAEAYLLVSAMELYQDDFAQPQALSRAMRRTEVEIHDLQQIIGKLSQEGGEHWDNLQLAQGEINRLDELLARATQEGGEHWDNLQKAQSGIQQLRTENAKLHEQLQTYTELENYQTQAALKLQALEEKLVFAEQVEEVFTRTSDQLTARIQELEDKLAVAEQEKETVLIALEDVFRSRSWRITRPLRGLTQFARHPYRFLRRITKAFLHAPATPQAFRSAARQIVQTIEARRDKLEDSPNNAKSLGAMLAHRNAFSEQVRRGQAIPPLSQRAYDGAIVDISVVTFNSEIHLKGLFESLLQQSIPLKNIGLFFVDHGSTDKSIEQLRSFAKNQSNIFRRIELTQQPNLGFGAGHDKAIQMGNAPWVLICNPDIVLHACALERVLGLAQTDQSDVAAWELRQQPYEHPKHYDPVTWETAWTSHACVLLRRQALEKVGGFDTRIFLYGEDVELSYRFRGAGYRLRYCPNAIAYHHTYAMANEIKPEQYIGSQVASVYLRLRYGSAQDLAAVPWFVAAMLVRPSPFWGARGRLLKRLFNQVVRHSLWLLKKRGKNQIHGIFPFRGFDYELRRQGAFVNQPALEDTPQWPDLPLVSVLTRTVRGRESLLAQAGYSVLQQTYPNIEWLVVEDGGDAQREVVDCLANVSGRNIRYSPLAQVGRSEAGNEALALARGQYCLFLDDDDLLYADHVETLMKPLLQKPQAAAAYGLCWSIESAFSPKGELVAEVHYGQISAHETPFDAQRLEFENFLPIQAVLFARRLFLERGGFNTELDALEDWNLWRRYSANETFLYVPKTTSLYRVPNDPGKKNTRQKTLDDAYQRVKQLSEADVRKLLTTSPEGRKTAVPVDLDDYVEKIEPAGHG